MVLSVHPLCQDIPLRAVADLDTNGQSQNPKDRTTPFITVVTDLGGVSLSPKDMRPLGAHKNLSLLVRV